MFKVLQFSSIEEYDAMALTKEQLNHLEYVSYLIDNDKTMLVKSRYIRPGIYNTWELD